MSALAKSFLDRIEATLTIPAAEYVPAIGDVFVIIREARAALQQEVPAEPVGWQPIETAPKDGAPMLLGYLPHPRMEGSRRVYEGRWNEEQNVWTSVNGFIVHRAATHWMPLPAPPAAEPAQQQEGAQGG